MKPGIRSSAQREHEGGEAKKTNIGKEHQLGRIEIGKGLKQKLQNENPTKVRKKIRGRREGTKP